MKISMIGLALAATICAVALGAGQALATTTHQTTPKTLKIVMHDPGCHWFMVGGKFATKATVTGRVRLVNIDETTVKVVSHNGIRRIPVQHSIVVGRGHYVVMMVGQAVDDNYLTLSVR